MSIEPWVEKYRPTAVEDLVLDSHVLQKLKSFTPSSVPNLLCLGEPGVGKTSAAIAIAKKICGENNYIELNASDSRGVPAIFDMVNTYCRSINEYPKVVILDEADNITKKAQQQLVNFMENYPHVKIFFTCNDFDQIIEPLQSRCMLMNFPKATKTQVVLMLSKIFSNEDVTWEEDAVHIIIGNVMGDMRACINACQAISVSFHKTITKETVNQYFCLPNTSEVYDLLILRDLNNAVEQYIRLQASGLSSIDVITIIVRGLQSSPLPSALRPLSHDAVYRILQKAHFAYYRMLQTVDSLNQMVWFLREVSIILTAVSRTPDS